MQGLNMIWVVPQHLYEVQSTQLAQSLILGAKLTGVSGNPVGSKGSATQHTNTTTTTAANPRLLAASPQGPERSSFPR